MDLVYLRDPRIRVPPCQLITHLCIRRDLHKMRKFINARHHKREINNYMPPIMVDKDHKNFVPLISLSSEKY